MNSRTSSKRPGVTQSSAWLSRRDWRRALDLYLEGRIPRSEFERMKERLARVREGATARARPHPKPRLRLAPGGLSPSAVLGPSDPAPTPTRLPREAA